VPGRQQQQERGERNAPRQGDRNRQDPRGVQGNQPPRGNEGDQPRGNQGEQRNPGQRRKRDEDEDDDSDSSRRALASWSQGTLTRPRTW
jgi:hypothetical protein